MLLVNLCTNDIIAVHIVYIHLLVISVEVLKLYLQFLLLGRKKKESILLPLLSRFIQ